MSRKSLFTLLIAGLLLQACSVNIQDTDGDSEFMFSRLSALEAESEIRNKLQTYMAVLEARDWDTYGDYFTTDARLIMTEGTRVGRNDILERMITATARMAATAEASDAPERRRVSLLSNIEVDVDDDTATSQSRFTFLSEDGNGGFEVVGSGLYIDEWSRSSNYIWRISSRTVDYDMLQSAAP